jgi:hypothetical protein
MQPRVMFIAWVLPLGWACGGTVGEARQDGSLGGAQTSQGGSAGQGGGSFGGGNHGGTASGGVSSTYVDPGCSAQAGTDVYAECDPLGDSSDCPIGGGCFPVTTYPSSTCQSEVYQMLCLPAGTAKQWDSCTTLTDCAAGFTCVVGSDGTMCLKMCDPTVASSCPTGLFCDAVDLQGIGICY